MPRSPGVDGAHPARSRLSRSEPRTARLHTRLELTWVALLHTHAL
jgi:hypothetical protein